MKKILSLILCLALALSFSILVNAYDYAEPSQTDSDESDAGILRLVDSAYLLDDDEWNGILALLDEISERRQFDVVIVTLDELDGYAPMDFADDFYDYYEYGFGDDHDGALLLISMAERDWWISTRGYGITALTDYGIDSIGSAMLSDLKSGDYYNAFCTFANKCDEFVGAARRGSPVDVGSVLKDGFTENLTTRILICLAIGLVIALIITGIMRGKLKSVHFKPNATDYVNEGSFNLTNKQDIFLFSNVTKVRRQSESGSSGGSSTHRSSSGASHGGGGGKF